VVQLSPQRKCKILTQAREHYVVELEAIDAVLKVNS
jgi:hypothetical protein